MITGIHISPSDIIIRKEAAKNSVFALLKKNQTIEATILKTLPDNKAKVLIAGKQIIIKSPFPLTVGEKIELNLLKQDANSEISILSSNENKISEKISSLIKLVSKANPFVGLVKAGDTELLEILKTISLKSDKTDETFLSGLIKKGGFLFEKKVATLLKQGDNQVIKNEILNLTKNDLKGYILNQLQAPGDHSAGNLKALSDYLLNIESFQTLNSQSTDQGKYLIPFPVFANDSFSFGQLLIDLGNSKEADKKGKQEKIINISFLLNMSKLGDLRADFSIYKKAISGVFNLSSIDVCEFVKAQIPKLKTKLLKREYLLHNIECKVAQKEDLTPTALVESFLRDEKRLLNIII